MKSKIKKILSLIFSLLVIAATLWGTYSLAKYIWRQISNLDSTLSTGIIAASTTVIVSVLSILVSKHLETKTIINNTLRERKTPTYENIINFIFKITFAEKLGEKQPSEKEMIKFFTDTTRDLVVWGSNDMILAFSKFREGAIANEKGNSSSNILFIVEDLMLAIRKDLGHSSSSIKRGDILRLYINDVDNYL
ncbi:MULTISPECIES: hypothetical protein [unclassified Pseudomonas]|uniref:hypothetical protein n=1 Tax=unclassified Pseudomonas TaxID=196821 RepID=UPI002446C493|nr:MULTISPECIES: hypothetical protein [unclassified Pseudomonas]MDG9930614.1 hypothetical protein [Pseudomonas sp. GD04042]MDH0485111.1 hypothetical protein [Pseudomonas sp. GD04015]MDH0605709.1 hypothetical protein [Pseudomonas sp. GD03869]